ncbi:DUF305 domain-containing protein [Streptomyces fradiae]|uniref:DUF305 domain-containing protein n=1 Tax=Streptomyces fradiae TaxID=1906 RepID=UPI00364DCDFE
MAENAEGDKDRQSGGLSRQTRLYLRFAAMILTAMVVMYWTMFAGTWEWSHVRWSESRLFMTLTMGGAMGLIMLAWMLDMYRNTKGNIAIVAASLLLLGGGVFLDRSQTTVQDPAWMSSMIPHHSLAITRSERAEITDVRVCRLAVEIIAAQEREIGEMDWLIKDIEKNGEARTPEEAKARPVPDFKGSPLRECPQD